jgi:hypothetical protein
LHIWSQRTCYKFVVLWTMNKVRSFHSKFFQLIRKKVGCNKRQQSGGAEYPYNLDLTAIKVSSASPPGMSTRKWRLDRLLLISAENSVAARIIRDDED